MATVLDVRDLRVAVGRGQSPVLPVDRLSLDVEAGECVGIVGESGSGKSLSMRALVGLLPRGARQVGGELRFAPGLNRAPQPYRPELVRGRGMSMVFQEPMTALNPTRRVGDLVADVIVATADRRVGRRQARVAAIDLLEEVGIPEPARRSRAYAHELSGGLRQRVMIAAALAGRPRLLVCDEPTTALDVTVQDQILQVFDRLRRDRRLAVLFVTHDLGVIARISQRVVVMYAGRVVEHGPTAEVLRRPRHPYTTALRDAVPDMSGRLPVGIPGGQPAPADRTGLGCQFADRCPSATDSCLTETPPLVDVESDKDDDGDAAAHGVACLHVSAPVPQVRP